MDFIKKSVLFRVVPYFTPNAVFKPFLNPIVTSFPSTIYFSQLPAPNLSNILGSSIKPAKVGNA